MTGRHFVYLPEINPRSFLLLYVRGSSGRSYSLRDFSTGGCATPRYAEEFEETAEDLLAAARFRTEAPVHPVADLEFWWARIDALNRQHLPEAMGSTLGVELPRSRVSTGERGTSAVSEKDDSETSALDLLQLYKDGSVNRASEFAEIARGLDVSELARAYGDLQEAAPRRHPAGRLYFVGHSGAPSTGASSNRREEHLAMALYNEFNDGKALRLPDGRDLRVLDYQFPLKAHRADKGIGKVDLLGVCDDGTPVVIELKVPSSSGGFGDSPLRALLEGIAYSAIVEANLSDIQEEPDGTDIRATRPEVVVLAPSAYWTRWDEAPGGATWRSALADLASRIHRDLDLNTHILGGELDFEMGDAHNKPRLLGEVELRDIVGRSARVTTSHRVPATRGAYLAGLEAGFWRYTEEAFDQPGTLLDREKPTKNRPPVFRKETAHWNVIVPPEATAEERGAILAEIPAGGRHRHFGSMKSSQALAQSLFGSLKAMGRLDSLQGLQDDDGKTAFFASASGMTMQMEHSVRSLNEPRATSVDVRFEGPSRIAVECKLTEDGIGTCSRTQIPRSDPKYATDHCDGTYRRQAGRNERCTLSELGIRYWELVPELLSWDASADLTPCPLDSTYQIVRNLLAACMREDGALDPKGAHMLLVYDESNPSFQRGGAGMDAWEAVRLSLHDDRVLRRCSWQRLLDHLECEADLIGLVSNLRLKYVSFAHGAG